MLRQISELRVRGKKFEGLIIDPLGDTLDGVDNWLIYFKEITIGKIYHRLEPLNISKNQQEYTSIWTAKLATNLYRIARHCDFEIPSKIEDDSIHKLIIRINNCWEGPISAVLGIRDLEDDFMDDIPF